MAYFDVDNVPVFIDPVFPTDTPGGTVKEMVSSSVQATTDLCVNLALGQGVSGLDVVTISVDAIGLAWKAGAYLYHRAGMKKQLAVCLQEYCTAGQLELHQNAFDPKSTKWTTTAAFHDSQFLRHVYKDIDQYMKDENVTDAELDSLGWRNTVTIHAEKRMPNVIRQLSFYCEAFGLKDITKTDLDRRLNVISFPHIGMISLTNAFLVEGERRKRREVAGLPSDHHLVPVLGRVLSIAAICGIREMRLSDITLLLGKAPMFETVARSRIAALRKHHASHVLNSLLFHGSTESAARDFAQQALDFRDQRTAVGRVVAPMTAQFDPAWSSANCEFAGSVDADQPVGTPIYMLAGWARLITQREDLGIPAGGTGSVFSQTRSTETDVHGNQIIHSGALPRLTFTIKALEDGTLMAKPRKFGQYDYLGSSNFNKGRASSKATGEEKHFGGLVGPVNCGCVADANKGRLTQSWKYSQELLLESRTKVHNSIQHTKQMITKRVSILWSSGDWPKGVFLMQTLPQSSYIQGRGECLYCAVENAALAGCFEVIACAGGKVTEEARNSPPATSNTSTPSFSYSSTCSASTAQSMSDPTTYSTPIPAASDPSLSPCTPTQSTVSSPTSPMTPPPPYSSPTLPTDQKMQSYFSPPQDTGIGQVAAQGVGKTMSVRRKPISSAAPPSTPPAMPAIARKPVIRAAITEVTSDCLVTPVDEKSGTTEQKSDTKTEDATLTRVTTLKRKPVKPVV